MFSQIRGKGTVTSLYEGDDFGKLALVNDAPRYKLSLFSLQMAFLLRLLWGSVFTTKESVILIQLHSDWLRELMSGDR